MLKKAVLFNEATARANSVLPVPGGPNSNTPFHVERHDAAAKYSGMRRGSTTASLRSLWPQSTHR